MIQGTLEGDTFPTQLTDLSTQIAVATRLYRTDDDLSGEVYVDVDNSARPIETILRIHESSKSTLARVDLYFWPKKNMWRLSSDDSEVLI